MRNVSFDVRYSFHLETMMATLYRRLEYLLYFILTLAGGLVLADVGNTALQGLVVIIVAFTSLTLRPARNALLCERQAARYRELMHDFEFHPDETELPDMDEIELHDNTAIGLLRNAAYKRTLIVLGYSQEANAIHLTMMEKIAAWFAGDLPEECVPAGAVDNEI
ncbi:hypothetical protein [Escherichia coli]|uniref:hypothetical protein n=1 Tax=Escherichia coli TaxID=562 RepID=UPI000BE47062|nr:hypothetical protein [Escherichia coli]MEC4924075.1 hypothetical protein [Escherichia coli]MEC4950335.1 hypothetical protein [Escherichia coli]MEC4965889.1 hypothetical protein [Escherichia coli]MEC5006645.1 hypothetical protein [Escherichia coli]MEC5017028.1 hypothetical protein [Escherichia coli]